MRAFIALLLVAVVAAERAPLFKNTEPIPNKFIVKVKKGFDLDQATDRVRTAGGKIGSIWNNVLYGFAVELQDHVVDFVRDLSFVEYVEEDGIYRTQTTWGIDRIDQRGLPLDNAYTSHNGRGAGTTVYVLDTGVRQSHEEFGIRAWQEKNFALGPNDDCNGHGTHCAGTIGSTTYGVAPDVWIRGIRVLGCLGSGSTSGIVDGINYVIAEAQKPAVASMSLGGGASQTLDNAVNDLVRSGIPTAVAAGNDNANACNYSPARSSEAITVGATDNTDTRSSFSNYGTCVDIFAPGTSITSTWNGNDSDTRTISGTSMATPHVAGAIALYNNDCNMLQSQCTSGCISNAGLGSPNEFLYV